MLSGGAGGAYRSILSNGGTFVRRLEAWQDGVRIDTTGDAGIKILGGSLSANLENRVTRRLSLTLPASLFPGSSGALLDPDRTELVLWCGWRGGAQPPYLWKVFTGPVVGATWTSSSAGFSLEASDRVEQIIQDKFISPVSSGAGALVTTRVKDLISDSQPGAVFGVFDETGATVPVMTWESDRAQAIDDMAAAVSCYWYQLPDGTYTMRSIPWGGATLASPVVSLTEGTSGMRATVTRSRSGVYTICQVTGEAADGSAPVSGVAYDTNPLSPAYYLGPLGRRVLKVQQDSVATVAQAESLARQRLRRSQAGGWAVSTSSPFDPALELGDVGTITTRVGTFDRALASFSADLVSATMSAQWRAPGGDEG